MNIQYALEEYHSRMCVYSTYNQTSIALSPAKVTDYVIAVTVLFEKRAYYYKPFKTVDQVCDWLYSTEAEQEAIEGAK